MRRAAVLLLLVAAAAQCAARSSISDSFHCPTPRLKNGRVKERGRGRIIRYSCYPDFELVGNKYSTCVRGSWDTPTPICVSTRCTPPPTPKHAVVGEKYRRAMLMYFCEPGFVLVGNAEIYCDGRQWNGTTPYCRDTNATAPTSCDFEKEGLCWWEQDPRHDFDWIKKQFGTPSSHIGTGPTHDHTFGAGYDGFYLYIEASGRLVNDTARIISPLYGANFTESGCFSFWYHMYGATIGSLNVYFKPETEKTPKLLWTKSGNQGNQWLRGLFNLPTVNSSFQIIIEGVRGSSYVSDIAVDDLALLQGEECIVKNATTIAPPPDGDEVEIFNSQQSCKERCVAREETTPSPEVYSNPDVCQCTLDCAESNSCCPDYAEYCIYEVSDPPETVVPWEPAVNGTSSPTVPSTTTMVSQESSMVTWFTRLIMTTEKPTTIKPVTVTEAPTFTRATTVSPSTSASSIVMDASSWPQKETTIASIKVSIAETPFELSTQEAPVTEVHFPKSYEPQFIQPQTRTQEPSSSLSLTGIVVIIIGILTGLTVTTTATLLYLRRRKIHKRGSNGSAFAEDSEVRYLTSNEDLDFTLARPADEEDGRTTPSVTLAATTATLFSGKQSFASTMDRARCLFT